METLIYLFFLFFRITITKFIQKSPNAISK